MKLAEVIGQVIPARVYDGLESVPMLLIRPLDEHRHPAGKTLVAADSTRMAGPGELVYYEGGREAALALDWKTLFFDGGSKDWNRKWQLDGEFATVKNTRRGMVFSAGPEEFNHAHHAVLWTRDSFKGDVRIEYDYTRLDKVDKWVNILYIQATGKGGKFAADIAEWADYRKEPWMKHYFENMKLLHVSYAAYGRDDLGADDDYVRCRRYPKAEDGKFAKTEIKPDFFHTGLFRTGKTYHITAIKRGDRLFFNVEGDGREKLFAWQSPLIGEVAEGRIGLRHMWMKSARYNNFTVSVLD